jgi:hypothetical protein
VPRSRFTNWPSWDFAAGSAGLALRVWGPGGRPRLWAGPGPLTLVQRRASAGALMADEDDLFAVPGGPLVLERTDRFAKHLRAMLRPPGGPARPAPVPKGADLHHLAVAGSLAAARVGDEIVVFDLPSGTVRRRLPMGRLAGTSLLGLAVSAAGDVALTVEDGGADYLGWAPSGAAEPAVLLAGTYVGWATGGCQLVSEATPGASADIVPAGRCVRTEAAFTAFYDVVPHGHPLTLPIRVRCLTAPGPACRVDLRVYGNRLGRVGRRVARIPVGRARLVRIRSRLAKLVIVTGRVIDPDGHRRIAVIL